MTKVRRYRKAGLLGMAAAALFVGLVACSNGAEGDRCQVLNGNDDCQDGLICLKADQVNPPYNNSDRCCQPTRPPGSVAACALNSSTGSLDATPPPDTGPSNTADVSVADTSTTDTGTDASASTDTGVEEAGADTGAADAATE